MDWICKTILSIWMRGTRWLWTIFGNFNMILERIGHRNVCFRHCDKILLLYTKKCLSRLSPNNNTSRSRCWDALHVGCCGCFWERAESNIYLNFINLFILFYFIFYLFYHIWLILSFFTILSFDYRHISIYLFVIYLFI